jgi:hypothetical protein
MVERSRGGGEGELAGERNQFVAKPEVHSGPMVSRP